MKQASGARDARPGSLTGSTQNTGRLGTAPDVSLSCAFPEAEAPFGDVTQRKSGAPKSRKLLLAAVWSGACGSRGLAACADHALAAGSRGRNRGDLSSESSSAQLVLSLAMTLARILLLCAPLDKKIS